MSKLLWILGAGAGAAALASAFGKNDGDKDDKSGGEPQPTTTEPKPEETEPKGSTPKPGQPEPPKSEGGTTVEPPRPPAKPPSTPDPWIPEPYASYPRGEYTIDLTGLGTGVRWRVYRTADNPQTESAKDAAALGGNVELSDDEARVAAQAFVDALLEAPAEPEPPLPPVPTPDGPDGGGAPMPPPDGSGPAPTFPPFPAPPRPALVATHGVSGLQAATPVVQRHGLNVDGCRKISVDSIVTWIAWAEPWVRDRVATMSPTAIVAGLLGTAFPVCEWNLSEVRVMGNRPLAETLQSVDEKYFSRARAGLPWPEQEAWEPTPLERAVAELVGVVAPAVAPPEFAFLGYHVDIVEVANGWSWHAWARGKNDGPPDIIGGPIGTMEGAAVAARVALTGFVGGE